MLRYINYASTNVLSSFVTKRGRTTYWICHMLFNVISYNFLRMIIAVMWDVMHKNCEKLGTQEKFSNNFCLIYETISNGKNKGELVECRLCLEDTICHASLFHELYYWLLNNWLFSLARSVLTIHSVARKSKDIVCYSRLLNFSLQSRLRVCKRSPFKIVLKFSEYVEKMAKDFNTHMSVQNYYIVDT